MCVFTLRHNLAAQQRGKDVTHGDEREQKKFTEDKDEDNRLASSHSRHENDEL
jgi:hypothetical protein